MAIVRAFNIGGIDLYTNTLLKKRGTPIRAVNVISEPYGAKSRRPGYITHLGTTIGSAVKDIFSWTKSDGSLYLYRTLGARLEYSVQGTGAWTLAGNGTIDASAHVGHAVLGETLVLGDGVGSTRHSTNGTSFTNTTLAPISEFFEQYQNRIFAAGTASTCFYSTTGDATNWVTSGTSDSSSFTVPGAGKNRKLFKANDRLVISKSSGNEFRWDGYSLVDLATDMGPTSPYSVDSREGYYFYLNRMGIVGYGGAKPQLISNAIQPLIYNNSGSAIVGTVFDTAPGEVHRHDYFTAVGTTTEDQFGYTINNAVLKYDFQKNEHLTFSFANNPKAMHSYKDINGNLQFVFGDSAGQCYHYGGTALTDNGTAVESFVEFIEDADSPEIEKNWRWFFGFFNPGCEARAQIYVGNYYSKDARVWKDIGDLSDGVGRYRIPDGAERGRFLFIRVADNSRNSRYTFYGYAFQADPISIP